MASKWVLCALGDKKSLAERSMKITSAEKNNWLNISFYFVYLLKETIFNKVLFIIQLAFYNEQISGCDLVYLFTEI